MLVNLLVLLCSHTQEESHVGISDLLEVHSHWHVKPPVPRFLLNEIFVVHYHPRALLNPIDFLLNDRGLCLKSRSLLPCLSPCHFVTEAFLHEVILLLGSLQGCETKVILNLQETGCDRSYQPLERLNATRFGSHVESSVANVVFFE